jgi:hypothetical protein
VLALTTRRIDWLAIRALLVHVAVFALFVLPLVLAACGPDNNGGGGGGPGSGY